MSWLLIINDNHLGLLGNLDFKRRLGIRKWPAFTYKWLSAVAFLDIYWHPKSQRVAARSDF